MIPIENIYYMLCYSWNRLEERDLVKVESLDSMTRAELFAKVLANGLSYVLRKGIDQGYTVYEEDGSLIKGRLDIGRTISKLLHVQGRAHCRYEDLSHNILRNQILRSIIGRLVLVDDLSSDLRFRLVGLYRLLNVIDEIEVSSKSFQQVRLQRLDPLYEFLMHVCELIHENLLVSEESGHLYFRDFLRNEREMARVFEEFVRNFYGEHLRDATIGSETIRWVGQAFDDNSARYLPAMRTDTSISFRNRKIVIDTKYYLNAIHSRFDRDTIISSNLYQLNAYLKNLEQRGGVDEDVEGILLYPVVNKELNLRYSLLGHKVTIATINLNQPWQGIHADLMELVS